MDGTLDLEKRLALVGDILIMMYVVPTDRLEELAYQVAQEADVSLRALARPRLVVNNSGTRQSSHR
jgi:hypothetical protein